MTTDRERLDDIRREFRRTKRLADGAIAQVDDEAFFFVPSDGSNSIAILVKHMAGNMRSRWRDFLASDGEKPDRDRDAEFELTDADSRKALAESWASGWDTLFEAIDPLEPEDLARTVTIRGEPLSVWQAVLRQLTHYAYHAGQIVTLARHRAGTRWESLSVPRGGSRAFNANPKPYITRE